MSLKAFHIFFIVASIVLAAGVGCWGWREFSAGRLTSSLGIAAASFLTAAGLAVYLFGFLGRMKKIQPS